MVSFSHLDEGTSEEVWRADERIAAAPLLHVDLDELVVVAAHPDDETLGAGGLMATAHAEGIPVVVIVATAGERSHPDSKTFTPERLTVIRRGKVIATTPPRVTTLHLDGRPGAVAPASYAPLIN